MNYSELLSTFLIDLQSFVRRRLSIPGASFSQIIAMSVIPSSGIEMTELAKKIGIDNSTATRLIIGLEKKSWVYREKSSEDRRSVKVFIGSLGAEIQQSLNDQYIELGLSLEKKIGSSNSQDVIEKISTLHWEILKIKLLPKKIV